MEAQAIAARLNPDEWTALYKFAVIGEFEKGKMLAEIVQAIEDTPIRNAKRIEELEMLLFYMQNVEFV